MKVTLLTLCFLLCAGLALNAQEEVTVTTIRVWVAVDGSKAKLTQNDFEVLEDGKKMTPSCFEEAPLPTQQEVAASEAEEEEAQTQTQTQEAEPLPGRSLKRIVLMIDEINTSQDELHFVKKRIDEFLNQMEGRTEIMLAAVPPYEELTPFTSNFYELRTRLDRIDGSMDRDQRVAERRRDIRDIIESRRPDAPVNAYNMAVEGALEEAQNVALVFDALKTFHKALNEKQQTEHTVLIFISGGLNSHPGQQYMDMVDKAFGENNEAMREMDRAHRNFGRTLSEALGSLNRDNITVYTINTRGQIDPNDNIIENNKDFMVSTKQMVDYRGDYQELMDQVAHDTGGVSFRNSLNFKHGFDAILNDLDRQYLICYVAPVHKKEGFHKIEVSTKVKGLKIRHRNGYID